MRLSMPEDSRVSVLTWLAIRVITLWRLENDTRTVERMYKNMFEKLWMCYAQYTGVSHFSTLRY